MRNHLPVVVNMNETPFQEVLGSGIDNRHDTLQGHTAVDQGPKTWNLHPSKFDYYAFVASLMMRH